MTLSVKTSNPGEQWPGRTKSGRGLKDIKATLPADIGNAGNASTLVRRWAANQIFIKAAGGQQ